MFTLCVGCPFNSQGKTSGLTEPDCPKRQTLLRPGCSRSVWLEERAATQVPSVAYGAELHPCSRSTQRVMARRPKNMPKPTEQKVRVPSQGDHPQNRRATSQGPSGGLCASKTDGVLALSVQVAYVLASVFLLYHVTVHTNNMPFHLNGTFRAPAVFSFVLLPSSFYFSWSFLAVSYL